MTKRLLSFFAGLIISASAMAQSSCVPSFPTSCNMPDPNYGICPDSVTNIPNGHASQAYSTSLSIKIPSNIIYQGNNVNLSQLAVINVQAKKNWTGTYSGLSTFGLSYLGNGSNSTSGSGAPSISSFCAWNANSTGCVTLSGTPSGVTANDTIYFLIQSKAGVDLGGFVGVVWQPAPDNKDYRLAIEPSSAGINQNSSNKFEINGNVPNPFTDRTTINFSAIKSGKVDFKVYNILGKLVYSETLNALPGENSYLFKNTMLNEGVYIYTLNNGTSTLSRRMVVGER